MRRAAIELLRLALLVVMSAAALQCYFLGRIAVMSRVDPKSTTFQRSEAWRLLSGHHPLNWSQQWVDSPLIAISLKRAVIASEDAGFVTHHGVEWDSIDKVWARNRKAEDRAGKLNEGLLRRALSAAAARNGRTGTMPRVVEPRVVGGSTITQQLAKNLFLGSERNLVRKGQELVVTLMLEALLSKRRILEIYLNSVEWGEGIFGAEAAARHYFHLPASGLRPQQAAQLAVMLPAPKRFEKGPTSAYVVGQAAMVAARMGAVDVP